MMNKLTEYMHKTPIEIPDQPRNKMLAKNFTTGLIVTLFFRESVYFFKFDCN
jgi:hypothetical protein